MTSSTEYRRAPHGGMATGQTAMPLQQLRDEIDGVDEAIMTLLSQRVRLAGLACVQKRRCGVPLFDTAREAAVVRRAAERAVGANLDPELIRDIYWKIVQLARAAQLDTEGDA